MFAMKKMVLAGTNKRSYLADVGNHYLFGTNILNKAMSARIADRVFSPAENSTTQDENAWEHWSIAKYPFAINGDNGKVNLDSYSGYLWSQNPDIFLSNGQANDLDDTYQPYWDSTLGNTAGNRYFCFAGIFGELTKTGDYIVRKNLYYNRGFLSGYSSDYVRLISSAIIAETDDYFFIDLYLMAAVYHSHDNILAKVNKRTLEISNVFALNSTYYSTYACKRMRVVDNKIAYVMYYSCPVTSSPNYNISSYTCGYIFVDLITFGVTYAMPGDASPHESSNVYQVRGIPSALTLDKSNTQKMKFYAAGGPTNPAHTDLAKRDCKIYRYTMSAASVLITDTPTRTLCTLSGLPQNYLLSPTEVTTTSVWSGYSVYNTPGANLQIITINSNNKEYLAVYTRPASPNYNTTVGFTLARQYMIIFEVSSADSSVLIYKNRLPMNGFGKGVVWHGILQSKDRKTLVWYRTGSYFVMRWNATTETYDIGPTYNASFDRISLDINNQLILEETPSRNIYIYNLSATNNVDVKFEGDIYSVDYSGTTINKNLLVNTYDSLGVRLARNVTLTLTGNASFTSGGGVTKTVTTSASANTTVGISITGTGTISVSPTLA